MSRIANNPVELPSGVEFKLDGQNVSIKGSKGALQHAVHPSVEVKQEEQSLTFSARGNAPQRAGAGGYHACAREQHGAGRE